MLAEIDGNEIDNSLKATRIASYANGFLLSSEYVHRRVQARPMKVKLIATHQTEPPIHELASRVTGNLYSVEGEVDFNPAPGGRYLMNGELKKVLCPYGLKMLKRENARQKRSSNDSKEAL